MFSLLTGLPHGLNILREGCRQSIEQSWFNYQSYLSADSSPFSLMFLFSLPVFLSLFRWYTGFSFSRLLGVSVQELCLIACTGLVAAISSQPRMLMHTEPDVESPELSPDSGRQLLISGPLKRTLLPPDICRSIPSAFLVVTVPDTHTNESATLPLSGWDTEESGYVSKTYDCSRCEILRHYLTIATVDKVSRLACKLCFIVFKQLFYAVFLGFAPI